MRNYLPVIFALALALTGCRTQPPPSTPAPPFTYTRIAQADTNSVQLQLALRKFVPVHHRGPAIWLAGTMHIGEPEYYRTLQKFLNAQTVVLYEGINTGTHKRHVPGANKSPASLTSPDPSPAHARTNANFSMQSALADSLGLVFQLDAIDYDRPNFLNSDLSLDQIERLMEGEPHGPAPASGQPAPRGNPSFDALLQIMDGSSFLGSILKMGLQFVGSNPKLQALAKLTLIEAIGRLKGDFSTLRDLPPDLKQMVKILIEARNQNVITDLKTELKIVPRSGSIAIFYGTGHMEDMEKHLTSELHYQPADAIWLTAFSVDFHKAGLSPSDVQTMRNLVKWQLNQMQ